MPNPEDEFERLLIEADTLPDGPAQVALLEQAVQLADTQLDLQWQFYARQCLIRAAFSGGSPDSLLVAVSWCLGVMDREDDAAERFDCDSLLWQCKHAIAYASSYLEISCSQFDALVKDVLQRYQQHGASPRSVYFIAMSGEFFMGHQEAGRRYYEQARRHPHDRFAETPAWEVYFDVEYYFETDQQQQGMQRLAPMLRDPRAARDVYSWFVYHALVPLLREGRAQEALRHQRRAYRQIAGNPKFVDHVGHHIVFLTLVRDFPRAIELLEKHLPHAIESTTAASRLFFWADALFLMNQLLRAGHDRLPLRLPPALQHLAGDEPQCEVVRLAGWLDSELSLLVERFNQRNGNQHVSEVLADIKGYEQWMLDRPLSGD